MERKREPCAARTVQVRWGSVVVVLLGGCARFGYELLTIDGTDASTQTGSAGASGDGGGGPGSVDDDGGVGARTWLGASGSSGAGGSPGAGGSHAPLDAGLGDAGASDAGGGAPDVGPWETCDDGVQNQDETGTDCGGASCVPCACSFGTPEPLVFDLGSWSIPANTQVWSPTLSADARDLLFAAIIPPSPERLYRAQRPAGGGVNFTPVPAPNQFTGPPSLLGPVNSSGNNGTPHLSLDGLRLYFSSDRAGGTGRDLYVASRSSTNDDFGNVTALAGVNSTAADQLPWLSPDELVLYFASERDGDSDIYRASRSSTSEAFSNVEPVAELNHPTLHDGRATLSEDERVVIFTRNRVSNSGDRDLYQALRASKSEPFGTPVPLAALNRDDADDADPALTRDGQELFFVSTRSALANPNGENRHFRAVRSCP